MPITALYALPLALIFLTLTFRTIGYRRANRISVGDGGDSQLLQRMRVHANCAEYAPLGLVVLGLAESVAVPVVMLHVLGSALVTGRLMHAIGMSQSPQIMPLRVGGMVLTTLAIAATALAAAGSVALQSL